MKRLWLAVGIFLISGALCILTLLYQQRQLHILQTELENVIDTFDNGDTARSYTLATALAEDYQRRTRAFSLFMAHEELHTCREALAVLPSILRDGDAEEFHMESTRCRILLEQLATSELPSLQNVF
jgi:hypothetical protein